MTKKPSPSPVFVYFFFDIIVIMKVLFLLIFLFPIMASSSELVAEGQGCECRFVSKDRYAFLDRRSPGVSFFWQVMPSDRLAARTSYIDRPVYTIVKDGNKSRCVDVSYKSTEPSKNEFALGRDFFVDGDNKQYFCVCCCPQSSVELTPIRTAMIYRVDSRPFSDDRLSTNTLRGGLRFFPFRWF